MKKSINLQSLIYRNYLASSLMPILAIEVLLVLLYFGVNHFIAENNQTALREEVIKNMQEITSREASHIDQQLKEIYRNAELMQRDHEAFFAYPDHCFLPNGEPSFGFHDNKAFYKLKDNNGGSLYYASTTSIGEQEYRKAQCSEMLDPLLVSLVETSPIVTQAYLNTWDDMNRIYPFIPDTPSQYGSSINMEDFNFYYLADAKHNPERKPVWTGAYLDPAGQGWMISAIVPIYRNNFLEGVSGLDVTIESFIRNILNLEMPWNSHAFMIDEQGMILAMSEDVERLLKVEELKHHDYDENIIETIEKPEEFNVLKSNHEIIRSQMRDIFNSKVHISQIMIDGQAYILSQEPIAEANWRIMTLVDESLLFESINKLRENIDFIGYIVIVMMILFYVLFFIYLLKKSRKLAIRIATPIEQLSQLTSQLGESCDILKASTVGIHEIDHLSSNFNEMTQQLQNKTQALVEARIREKIKERRAEALKQEAITDHLTELYNRRKIDEFLKHEIVRSGRLNQSLAILLLDIDHFKDVNDTYGHQIGDQVIIEVAQQIKWHTRSTAIIGRWGGEEFMVISPQTNEKEALNLAERLRENIARHDFAIIGQKTVSIGVTLYQSGDELEEMILRVDQALYKAKREGRNRVVLG